MKTNNKKRRSNAGLKVALGTLCVLLVAAGGMTGAQAVVGAEAENSLTATVDQPANNVKKTEVVYAKLDNAGVLQNTYVVNTLEPAEAGTLVDFGSYKKVQNLTNAQTLGVNDDAVIVDITPDQANKAFSYQGDMGIQAMPWAIEVSYTLDGEAVSAQDLAGASGKMGLSIHVAPNYGEADRAFCDNYLVTATVTLGGAVARNVSAPDAQVAMAGSDVQLTFMVMPGKSATLTAEADVKNFEMAGIQVAAIPFAIAFDFPDTNDMISRFSQLTDAVGTLEAGAAVLAAGAGDLASGADALSGGASELAQGADGVAAGTQGVAEGLALYQGGLRQQAADLEAAAAALGTDDELAEAYTQAMMDYLQTFAMSFAQEFPQAYADAYAAAIASGMDQQEATRVATEQGAAVAASAAQEACQEQQAVLQQCITNIASKAGYLGSAQALIGAADGVGSADDQETLLGGAAAVASGATQLSGGAWELADGAGQIADGLDEYAGGSAEFANGMGEFKTQTHGLPDTVKSEIDKLMAEYDKSDFVPRSFVSSKNTNVKLVQFVMSTEGITIPKEEKPADPEPELTPLDRLMALFQ